jgi:16S rRNA (guanine1516-N2)-methyltransferase
MRQTMAHTPKIAVFTTEAGLQAQARALAKQLQLPWVANNTEDYQYLLVLTPNYLGLQKVGAATPPLSIDFLTGKNRYRREHTSLRKEALARALGLKGNTQPTIVDATAGVASDSFILACLGFKVQLLERSPIVHSLLADAIQRAQVDPIVGTFIQHLHLIQADAQQWLKALGEQDYPDIIYLDPMFPTRKKSALPNKHMIFFQEIIGDDADAGDLLNVALSCAKQRVVVKRPRLAKPLADVVPDFNLVGSSSRFDVYLCTSPSALSGAFPRTGKAF